ncbi:hypothetical protein [Providencia sp. Je.9.19]|uniref:hypothetical protein n=1 Tax=Providencia sp. Je.9.19 TaxID=3142844 RepID=UPI003DA8F64F
MLGSVSKQFLANSTEVKNNMLDITRKIKKNFTKKIKKIKQTPKILLPILRGNNKTKANDIKQVDIPRQCILKDNSNIQLRPEGNTYKIELINRPVLPLLIEAFSSPNEIENSFYRFLKQNEVDSKDIYSIKKIVAQMKGVKSSDDVVIKLYDLCEILSDKNKKYVTNKFIISYLEEPARIEESKQSTNLSYLSPLPAKTLTIEPQPIDVADKLYSKLTEMIFSMSRQHDILGELLADFQAKIDSLKQNETAETFTLKLKELCKKAYSTQSDFVFEKIKISFSQYIDVESELIKFNTISNVIDDTITGTVPNNIKTKLKGIMKRLFNTIEWQIFYAVKKIREIYSDMKKSFHS